MQTIGQAIIPYHDEIAYTLLILINIEVIDIFLTDFSQNFRTWNSARKENIYFIMLWRGLTSHISVLRYDSIFSFNSKYIKHNINTKYRETLIPSNSTRVILYFGNVSRSCSTCTPVVLFMSVQICHMHKHQYKYAYKKVKWKW